MTARERMLTVLNNGQPDHLPCQVHGWMDYYLKTYLDGMDWWDAYAKFDMDHAIYVSPRYMYDVNTLADWESKKVDLAVDKDGNHQWEETISTPKGDLHRAGAWNEITEWTTEWREGHYPISPVQPRPRQPLAEFLYSCRYRKSDFHGRR